MIKEEKFNLKAKDEEIIETINDWLKESETYHNELLKAQKTSYDYYIGDQSDRDMVPTYLSNTVENRIFEAVETMVPIATSNPHEFVVLPASEDEKAKARASNLQKILERKYETLEMQRKLEEVTRNLLVMRFGVMKYMWDVDADDVEVKVIDPRLILVPRLRTDPHHLPYVMEVQGYSRDEMEEFFEVDPDDYSEGMLIDTGATKEGKKEFQVIECWTNEMVAWKCKDKLLKKMPNPNYDFEGTEVTETTYSIATGNMRKKKKIKYFNHFDNPEKPYVFFATFNLSEGPLPSTGLVEIAIPIADSINVQKRGIINNLKQMGNGQVYADAEALTQEETENITNEPGLVIRGKGLASENRIRREPGTSLPNAHFSNLQHSESVFDNLMGTHSATRGSANAKTLGQDILSRQQDFSRLDLITRVLNRGVARLANGLVQIMKMNYDETHLVKVLGEEGAAEFVALNRNDIDDYIEIMVKSGEKLPMDEVSLRTEAVQLWQIGALDPVTLFERLKFPHPEKAAERLVAWKQGQLDQETQAKIQIAREGAQANAQAKLETEGGGASEKGLENPLSVLQRARAELGGRSPAPKNS